MAPCPLAVGAVIFTCLGTERTPSRARSVRQPLTANSSRHSTDRGVPTSQLPAQAMARHHPPPGQAASVEAASHK